MQYYEVYTRMYMGTARRGSINYLIFFFVTAHHITLCASIMIFFNYIMKVISFCTNFKHTRVRAMSIYLNMPNICNIYTHTLAIVLREMLLCRITWFFAFGFFFFQELARVHIICYVCTYINEWTIAMRGNWMNVK